MDACNGSPACTFIPNAHRRAKGLAGIGSFKAGTLASLAYSPGISSINLSTHKTCAQGACSVLIGIECLPSSSSTKCNADSSGNIGDGNDGSGNYGTGNAGSYNIGATLSWQKV